jgi:hypothetical protein
MFGPPALGVVLAAVLASACGRSRSNPHSNGSGAAAGSDFGPGTGGTTTGGSGTGGSGTGGSGTGGRGIAAGGTAGMLGEAGATGTPTSCSPTARGARMRLLTRFQYDNVLNDVLGDDSRPARSLTQRDLEVDLAVDGAPTSEWVTELHALTHDLADAYTASDAALKKSLGCDLEVDGEAGCTAALFGSVLPRLFRKPLEASDLDQFETLLAMGTELGGDFASGVRMVLEVALQAPELVYRAEVGEPLGVDPPDPRSGWARPTPFEMASRLSFLLWGSAPDEALLAEAAAGGLRTQEEVGAAALRLLDDERSVALTRYVHLRLLGLVDGSLPVERDPAYTESVFSLMQSETAAFLDDVSSAGEGGFSLLLTAPYTYLNEELAAFYGIPDVVGPELRKVDLASPPYSGVLTQGSFLSAHAWSSTTAPALRGRAVLNAFLCANAPLPPPDLPSHSAPPPPDGVTTRQHIAEYTQTEPRCAGCHVVLNAPGFALEHFDHLGRYRETEAGLTLDTKAEIEIDATRQPVDGAEGLGSLLAESPEARQCYVQNWAAYAYAASTDAPLDECSRAQLADVFERTNGDVRALLFELTQTDAFLYLSSETL